MEIEYHTFEEIFILDLWTDDHNNIMRWYDQDNVWES